MIDNSRELADQARILSLQMTHRAKASHIASSLSVMDIIACLYANPIRFSKIESGSHDRDVIILSKGHAAAALYSVLAVQGLVPLEWLEQYCSNGSKIGGHVTSNEIPTIELSTGSLGHGFPYGIGVALGRKFQKTNGRIFVIISDGECDEGTTWESLLLGNQFDLNNLVVIVDRNRIQSLGDTEKTLKLDPLDEKIISFGWDVAVVNGHDHVALSEAIETSSNKPKFIIAETTKGFGVSFMENKVLWHYKWPDNGQLAAAIQEIGGQL